MKKIDNGRLPSINEGWENLLISERVSLRNWWEFKVLKCVTKCTYKQLDEKEYKQGWKYFQPQNDKDVDMTYIKNGTA